MIGCTNWQSSNTAALIEFMRVTDGGIDFRRGQRSAEPPTNTCCVFLNRGLLYLSGTAGAGPCRSRKPEPDGECRDEQKHARNGWRSQFALLRLAGQRNAG